MINGKEYSKDHKLSAMTEMEKFQRLVRASPAKAFMHVSRLADWLNCDKETKWQFKDHWDNLDLDRNYENCTTRHRRILRYWYDHPGVLTLNPDNIYQAKVEHDANYIKGANILTYASGEFIGSMLLKDILDFDLSMIEFWLVEGQSYSIDIDLFRVSAKDGKTSPTTSGKHQDGEDWLFLHFIGSKNAEPVVSTIYGGEKGSEILFQTALSSFLETLIVNDRLLYHAAEPVKQRDPGIPACRDLLLVCLSTIDGDKRN